MCSVAFQLHTRTAVVVDVRPCCCHRGGSDCGLGKWYCPPISPSGGKTAFFRMPLKGVFVFACFKDRGKRLDTLT